MGFPVLLRISLISQHEAAFPFSLVFVCFFFKGKHWPHCIRLLSKDRNWNWYMCMCVIKLHHIFRLVYAGPLQQDYQPAFINTHSALRRTKINVSANVSCWLNDSLQVILFLPMILQDTTKAQKNRERSFAVWGFHLRGKRQREALSSDCKKTLAARDHPYSFSSVFRRIPRNPTNWPKLLHCTCVPV